MRTVIVPGAVVLAAVLAVGMGSKPKEAAPASNVEANKKLVLDMAQMLFVEHRVDEAVDKYFDPNYIQHNPIAPDGAETIRALFKGFYQNAPTATYIVKRIICEGDLCAVHSNSKLKADERGSAVVDIFRIANGKIAEHWDVIQAVPEKSANNNTMF
jgi:predicted SnoaL-like aldol condensation-catalyzing enzyme